MTNLTLILIKYSNPTPTPTPDCESRDHPGPLIEIIPASGPGTRGLRRNSISLPAGLDTMDLAALRAAHKAEDEANDKVYDYEFIFNYDLDFNSRYVQ